MGEGSLRPGRPASGMNGCQSHPCCWGGWGPARAPDGWPVHPGRAPTDQMTLFYSQKVPEKAGELRPSEMRLSASLNHYLPHNSSEKRFASISVGSGLQPKFPVTNLSKFTANLKSFSEKLLLSHHHRTFSNDLRVVPIQKVLSQLFQHIFPQRCLFC